MTKSKGHLFISISLFLASFGALWSSSAVALPPPSSEVIRMKLVFRDHKLSLVSPDSQSNVVSLRGIGSESEYDIVKVFGLNLRESANDE